MLDELKKRISAAFDSALSQGPTSLVPPKPPEPELTLDAEFSTETVPVVVKPRVYSERHEAKFLRRAKALCETAIKDPVLARLSNQNYSAEKSFYIGSIDGPVSYDQAVQAAMELLGKDSNEPKKS